MGHVGEADGGGIGRSPTTGIRYFLAAVFVLISLLFVLRSVRQAGSVPPFFNWDMVSYSALALAWGEEDPSVVHRSTYETLQRELPESVFRSLTTGEVRGARYRDQRAFTEFLAFQRSRILYTFPLYVLHEHLGLPLSRATWWMSRASWLALALLMCIWAARSLGAGPGFVVGALLAQAPWLVMQMGLSSPDLAATFLASLGVFFWLELRRDKAAATLLSASVLVRPDAILLCTALALVLWFRGSETERSRGFLALWMAVTWAGYLLLAKLTGAFGWWPFFRSAFGGMEIYPSEIPTQPDFGFYVETVKQKAAEFPYPGYFLRFTKWERGRRSLDSAGGLPGPLDRRLPACPTK